MKSTTYFSSILFALLLITIQGCQKRAYCTYYSTGGAIRLYEKDFSNSREYY